MPSGPTDTELQGSSPATFSPPRRSAPSTVVSTLRARGRNSRPASSRLSAWWSCDSSTRSTSPISSAEIAGPSDLRNVTTGVSYSPGGSKVGSVSIRRPPSSRRAVGPPTARIVSFSMAGSLALMHRARDPERVGLRDVRLEPQQQAALPPQQRVGGEPRRVALHLAVPVLVHEDVRLARDPDPAPAVHGHRGGGCSLSQRLLDEDGLLPAAELGDQHPHAARPGVDEGDLAARRIVGEVHLV